MELDVRTLLITNFSYTLLIAFSFAISYRGFTGPVRSSLKNLSNALFLMSLGWVFLALRGLIPDIHSVLWGNLALFFGLIEIYHSIRIFDEKHIQRKKIYAFVVICMICNLFFLLLYN
nr:hypothetical protein [Anaerolineaceae bacterium]